MNQLVIIDQLDQRTELILIEEEDCFEMSMCVEGACEQYYFKKEDCKKLAEFILSRVK